MSLFAKCARELRLAPVYLAFLTVFGLAGGNKVMKLSSGAPEGFLKMFEGTFLGTSGLTSLAYFAIVAMEVFVCLGVLISLILGEFRYGKPKPILVCSLILAATTFACLGFGLRLAGDSAMAASLFMYFGATLVSILYVESTSK